MAGGDLIRAATFQGFQSLVFELGSDPEAILNEAGLTGEELADPEAQVSVVSFHDALNIAADVTQTPRFGLLLAQRQSFEMLGAVGYATKHAPDLRTAIEELSTYMGTHDISARSFLEVDANTAFWCYANNSFESGSIVQHVELALSLGVNFMRSALGQSWKANAVHYQHSKPKDCTLYARLLRCPVYFDNDFNGIEFDADLLDQKLAHTEKGLFGILHAYLEMTGGRTKETFSDRTTAVVIKNIEKGDIGIEQAAKALGISRTHLQRKLSKEGTSYQELTDRVRYDLACRYLNDTEMPLTSISSILCYSELAAFSRAFKRKSGMSPSVWRSSNEKQAHL